MQHKKRCTSLNLRSFYVALVPSLLQFPVCSVDGSLGTKLWPAWRKIAPFLVVDLYSSQLLRSLRNIWWTFPPVLLDIWRIRQMDGPPDSWDSIEDPGPEGNVEELSSNLSHLNVNARPFVPNVNAPAFVPSFLVKKTESKGKFYLPAYLAGFLGRRSRSSFAFVYSV